MIAQNRSWVRYAPATAVLVAVLVGACSSGAPSGPTVGAPTPTMRSSPSPRPFEGLNGALEPGTYSVSSVVPAEITFTVPSGWRHSEESPSLVGPHTDSGVGLSFWVVEDLRSNPCDPASPLLDPRPGPTVDELSTALAAQPRVETSEPAPAQVAGFEGTHLAVAIPANSGCAYQPWPNPDRLVLPGAGDVDLWILDVAGARLVMMAWATSDAPAEDRAELESVIDSIRIDA